MSRTPIRFSLFVALLSVFLTPLMAQQNPNNQPNRNLNNPPNAKQTLGDVDNRTAGGVVRASKLMGMNLYNSNNDSVGEIKDLVLNAASGQVEYVAVTYGGFLGLGNKLFAVPFEAIKYEVPANGSNSQRLILNVTKQQMEGAVGFDEDRWPNFADQNFTDELYKRYRIERRRPDGTRSGVDIRAGQNGVDVNINK